MPNLSSRYSNILQVPTAQSPLPAGTIIQYAGSVAPSGWLECSGQELSRTDYADLWNAISSKYGAGDGSTTFNIPNGPRRTSTVELLSSEFLASANNGGALNYAEAIAKQTIEGQWYVEQLSVKGTKSNNTTDVNVRWHAGVFNFETITHPAISYFTSNGYIDNADGIHTGTNVSNYGGIYFEAYNVRCFAAPNWALANLESIPIIKINNDNQQALSVGINQADQLTAGVVKSGDAANETAQNLAVEIRKATRTLDNEFTGGDRDIKIVKIDDVVTISGLGLATHGANASPESSPGLLPEWAWPPVERNNTYQNESGRVNSCFVRTDGTIGTYYRQWTGGDSHAGHTGDALSITYHV